MTLYKPTKHLYNATMSSTMLPSKEDSMTSGFLQILSLTFRKPTLNPNLGGCVRGPGGVKRGGGVRIMLETWNSVSTHTYVVWENIPFSTKVLLVLLMSTFFCKKQKTVNKNVSFTDYASGIRLPNCSKLAINRKNDNDATICWNDVIINIFDVILFLLSSLGTGQSFMSISSLVLELWQFTFIIDWPEIRKSEIPPSEFCLMSEDWGK